MVETGERDDATGAGDGASGGGVGRVPFPALPPEDPDLLAGLDWVVEFFDRHLVALEDDLVVPAMSVAFALGFAGATRRQVWWVLREVRLRTVMASLLATMRRLPATPLPEWAQDITARSPQVRRVIAEEAKAQEDDNATVVSAERSILLAAAAAHPDAAWSEDRTSLALPFGALEEVANAARSISFDDISRLVEVARDPIARRLREALTATDADPDGD